MAFHTKSWLLRAYTNSQRDDKAPNRPNQQAEAQSTRALNDLRARCKIGFLWARSLIILWCELGRIRKASSRIEVASLKIGSKNCISARLKLEIYGSH
jgi:hypothetical protein